MCGIVGYVGVKQAAPILLSGLSKLEYRGYDSAGLAVRDEANEHIEVVKAKGRLKNLMEMTDSGNAVHGLCGIGHTRWATHGEPSTVNAHPQYTREKRVVIGTTASSKTIRRSRNPCSKRATRSPRRRIPRSPPRCWTAIMPRRPSGRAIPAPARSTRFATR